MEAFIKILEKMLIEINNSVNEKITGLTFLEHLKFEIIEKIKNLDEKYFNNLKLDLSKKLSIEKKIEIDFRSILCKIEYFEKSVSKIKSKTENDLLCLIMDGAKKIVIFDSFDKNKTIQSILLKNMGFVICKGTIITSEINKNSIVLTFLNI